MTTISQPFSKIALPLWATLLITLAWQPASASPSHTSRPPLLHCNQTAMIPQNTPSYTLKLPSNLTTGFRWYLLPYNTQMVTIQHYEYSHPTHTQPPIKIGQPGHEQWQIQVQPPAFAAPTIIPLQFVKARAFALHTPVMRHIFCLVTLPKT